MKLYNVPRNTNIRFVYENQEYLLRFHHVDGMYSYCTDQDGKVVHLAATADVEVVDNNFVVNPSTSNDLVHSQE